MKSDEDTGRAYYLLGFAKSPGGWMRSIVAALALAACQLAASAQAQQSFPVDPELPVEFSRPPPRPWRVSLATGFEYDSGIAGETNELFVPLSLRVEYGAFSLSAATSMVKIDGRIRLGAAINDFNSLNPTDTISRADIGNLSFDETGIGDTLLSVSYAWFDPDAWLPFVELGYSVKIPTGSARDQIGTGEYDWILQLDLAKQLGRFTPFASVSYRFNGGPVTLHEQRIPITHPTETVLILARARVPVDDTVELSLGSSFHVGDLGRSNSALHAGLLYDFQQSPFRGVSDDHELVPYLTFELSDRVQFGPYFVIGLSNSAPDWGIATQLLISY